MPVVTNLKFNPNKVYAANVNHLKELQMIKAREQEYQNQCQSYIRYDPGYTIPQPYYPYMVQSPPICPEPAPVPYYQPGYIQVPNQYYSPPQTPAPYYGQSVNQMGWAGKKPVSKLSTKSPHAITGHKLVRKNTDFTPKGATRGLGGLKDARIMTPAHQPTQTVNFTQAYNNDNSYQKEWNSAKIESTHDGYSNPYEVNHNYIRKSTLDETEYYFQQSVSPFSSPEERNMQMRIVNNFKLNPFPLEGEEYNDYPVQIANSQRRMSKLHEEIKNEDENSCNYFDVFSENIPTFQKDRRPGTEGNSGPIFNLLSQADASGQTN